MKKTVYIEPDEFTAQISGAFDYEFDGTSTFETWEKPIVPEKYNIGLIVGASGTGKSTLLKEFGEEDIIEWDPKKAIISHFQTAKEGMDKLSSVGLNSVPSWCKPYHVLSTGEKFRADLARRLHNASCLDEFTSVVDRTVAKATSFATQKYIRKNNIENVIFSTCHEDVAEWLEPDWIFNTNNGQLLVGRSLRRPIITVGIFRCTQDLWGMFKNHHYLTAVLSKSSRTYVAVYDGKIIGFSSVIAMPGGTVQNAWREHRTVVLPDYQGMGIGTRISDAMGEIYIADGKRYFSKTAHIRMGEYRNSSSLWRPTSKNQRTRTDNVSGGKKDWIIKGERLCYSHEYIGKKDSK